MYQRDYLESRSIPKSVLWGRYLSGNLGLQISLAWMDAVDGKLEEILEGPNGETIKQLFELANKKIIENIKRRDSKLLNSYTCDPEGVEMIRRFRDEMNSLCQLINNAPSPIRDLFFSVGLYVDRRDWYWSFRESGITGQLNYMLPSIKDLSAA